MGSKFSIEEITSLEEWDDFSQNSLQYTMFVSSNYLESYGGKYKLFFVKKGIEKKASFCLLLSDDEKEIVLDDLIIYSGILYNHNQLQKEVKARSERFEIAETIINFITTKYTNIEMALSTKVEDMRPFLWHNYGSKNKKEVFTLDLRYTSYIDISELSSFEDEEKTSLFKNLETLRQRNIRKARKESSYTIEELHTDIFLEYYVKLMKNQNQEVSKEKLANMSNIINNTVNNKQAVMYATKNSKNEILYLTVFSFDRYRAYYLFGAGNPDAKEVFKGTICFWDAFVNLAQEYNIKEIDMEGVNSPQRGWFKLSFGGDLKPYYEIKIGE